MEDGILKEDPWKTVLSCLKIERNALIQKGVTGTLGRIAFSRLIGVIGGFVHLEDSSIMLVRDMQKAYLERVDNLSLKQ